MGQALLPHAFLCPGFSTERLVSTANYVKAVKRAKAHLTDTFPYTLCGWSSGTGADIVREFHSGMHDRINLRGLAAGEKVWR